MNDLIIKLLQSSLAIMVLWGLYVVFLRRDTFFKTNRIYLVSGLLFSMILPFINPGSLLAPGEQLYMVFLDPVVITADGVQKSMMAHPSLYQILLSIYLTGVVIFSLRFIYQLWQLLRLVRSYGISRKDGMRIVCTDRNYSPFSFFNLVFLNRRDLESEETRKILAHEKIHIRQWHSMDLLLLEIITIFQWFNPVIWLYRHALKSLHEYLADEGVIHSGVDHTVYRALLFQQSTGIQINDLTNNFSKSLLKRRFTMMTKNRTNQAARMKLLLALPLALTMLLLISFSPEMMAQQEKETKTPPPPPKEKIVTTANPDDPPPPPKAVGQDEVPIFTVVEEMPEFPGGRDALSEYIASEVKYPEEAKKKGIQGRVFVTYVVEKDGSISNVALLRGAEKTLDAEALRVIKGMPKWTPGKQKGKPVRVQFNLPIHFALDNDKEKETEKPE